MNPFGSLFENVFGGAFAGGLGAGQANMSGANVAAEAAMQAQRAAQALAAYSTASVTLYPGLQVFQQMLQEGVAVTRTEAPKEVPKIELNPKRAIDLES